MRAKLSMKKSSESSFATTAKKETPAIPKLGLKCTSSAINQVVTSRIKKSQNDPILSKDDKTITSDFSSETVEEERRIARLTSIGNLQFSKNNYDEALKHYEEALHLVLPPKDFHDSILRQSQNRRPDTPEMSNVTVEKLRKESAAARLLMNIGSVNTMIKQSDEAVRYFEMSLQLAETVEYSLLRGECRKYHDEMIMQTHIIKADVLQNIALVHSKKDQLTIAKAKYDESLQFRRLVLSFVNENTNTPNHNEEMHTAQNDLVDALTCTANVNNKVGEYSISVELYSEAIFLQQSIDSQSFQSSDISPLWTSLGDVYCNQENNDSYERALRCYQKVYDIACKRHGPHNPLFTVEPLIKISKAYLLLGDNKESLAKASEAVNITRAECDERDDQKLLAATALESLSYVHRKMELHADALKSYRECLYMRISVVGEAHDIVVNSLKNIGEVLCDLKEYTQAIDMYKDSLRRMQDFMGRNHPFMPKFLYWIGSVYRRKRDFNRAVRYFVKAIDMIQKNGGNRKSPLIGDIMRDTGSVLVSQKRWNDASDHFNLAMKIYRDAGLVATHPDVVRTAKLMAASGKGQNSEREMDIPDMYENGYDDPAYYSNM